MNHKYVFPLLAVMLMCSSCVLNITNENSFTATPGFVTSTLPPTKIPPPTHTSIPTTPTADVIAGTEEPIPSALIEGVTTTQLNVRAEPSTASETLGIVNQFATVQIIGRDASGSWYQISYADSKGWIRAEYVQVNVTAEIPVIGSVTGSGSGVSGLVIQKINVRNGPGLNYELLGVLNPKDVVFITGKDSSGDWMQIEFTNAADGKGWAAVKYLQVENTDSIPVTGPLEQTTDITPTPSIVILPAAQDGDSMQAPAAVTVFSATGTHVLQVNGDVSAPDGDTEDWIQVTNFSQNILVEAKCSGNALRVELWSDGHYLNDVALACGGKLKMETTPNQSYYFRIQANSDNDPQYVHYVLKISSVE